MNTPREGTGMVDDARQIAEAVRTACVAAALAAYEDAGFAGLCAEGRWEAAVGAVRALDVGAVAVAALAPQTPPDARPQA